jgi:hypothetical protein
MPGTSGRLTAGKPVPTVLAHLVHTGRFHGPHPAPDAADRHRRPAPDQQADHRLACAAPSATGELAPGAQLPSVRGLATQLSINPNTVAKAYAELTAEAGWSRARAWACTWRRHASACRTTNAKSAWTKRSAASCTT